MNILAQMHAHNRAAIERVGRTGASVDMGALQRRFQGTQTRQHDGGIGARWRANRPIADGLDRRVSASIRMPNELAIGDSLTVQVMSFRVVGLRGQTPALALPLPNLG